MTSVKEAEGTRLVCKNMYQNMQTHKLHGCRFALPISIYLGLKCRKLKNK